MSDTIEIQGRTIEDAIAEALLQLGARRDEVDVKVLDEGKSGLLRLFGARPARVRVTRRPDAARPSGRREGRDTRDARASRGAQDVRGGRERADEGRRGARDDRNARGGRDRDRGREGEGRGERAGGGPRAEREPRAAAEEGRPQGRPAPEARPGGAGDEDAQRKRRRRGGRGRRRRGEPGQHDEAAGAGPAAPRATAPSGTPPPPPSSVDEAPRATEWNIPAQDIHLPQEAPGFATSAPDGPGGGDAAAEATPIAAISLVEPLRGAAEEEIPALIQRFATELMVRSGFPCRCEVRPGEYHQVRITTDEASAGVLIGRHGGTIDAIEHLVERMTSHATGATVHMNLDINNYRRRREEKLVFRARQTADRVQATGQEESFEPLCARERRVVHLEVAKLPGLQTFTVADEFGKRVVVAPAGATPPPDASSGAEADAGEDTPHDGGLFADDDCQKPREDGSDRPADPGRDDA